MIAAVMRCMVYDGKNCCNCLVYVTFLIFEGTLILTYQEIAVKYNGQKSFYIGSKCFFNIAFDAVSLCAHSVCLFPGILISRDSFSTTDSRKKFQVQISYC